MGHKMIKLHHLNKSRSKRIIWLLEELDIAYEVIAYQRDSLTFLAPPELKQVHPLGKSPVIEDDELVIAESGAITEYLIEQHSNGKLAPKRGSTEYVDYLQWMHFAESSGILPPLLKIFVMKDGCETNFLADYADTEIAKIAVYLNDSLQGKRYLVADRLTGADIMMSFVAEALQTLGIAQQYPNIETYLTQLQSHPAYVKAEEIESDVDNNSK